MMRRCLAVGSSVTLVLIVGCGLPSYEARLKATEGRLKDRMELDRYLDEAPKEPFERLGFYFRPPKGMPKAAEFAPAELPPGLFDIAETYQGSPSNTKTAGPGPQLHVLARRKQAQKTQSKKDAPPPPSVDRKSFNEDLMDVLGAVYGEAATSSSMEKASQVMWPRFEPPRTIPFERRKFAGRDGDVLVYTYSEKTGGDEYDIAFIWEVPAAERQRVPKLIELALGTFATGTRARNAFKGGAGADSEGAISVEGGSAPGF